MRRRAVLSAVAALALASPLLAAAGSAGAAPVPTPAAPRATAAPAADDVVGPGTRLYVDPFSTTLQAAAALTGQARADAQLLGSFPSASWFTGGTPDEVRDDVASVVRAAATDGSVPTVVVYNLPFRDCAQYSAGGAADTAAYTAWVDAVAEGIGDDPAIVILEPDGLGIIPWYTDINGNPEWCRPAELDPETAAADRFVQLNHAVDALTALPATSVYLDGTHSGWLGVGDITDRLIKAGVERADGVFVNASNYVETERLVKYGTWISDCVNLSVNSWWEPAWCASQYYPANPDDVETWGLTDAAYAQAYADTGVARDPAAQKHVVVDTSRNGQGPWTAPSGVYADPEVWCNPPDRGLGERPTTDTGDPFVDAYLWIKVPGESDGKCYRGTGGPLDPARGIEDPAAGQWFVEQAAELLALASPAVERPTCEVAYTVHGTWQGKKGSGFIAQVELRNTGASPLDGWELRWTPDGDQRLTDVWGAQAGRDGAALTAHSLSWNARVRPGATATFGFVASGAPGAGPQLVTLGGRPCHVV
ncbi:MULTISPECIES: glycoside hydrolase family 6 protein [Cellulosimicrobium]|uniref:glycoside hydrolase family 6 protein n=1 Tax=Cellulosimicrobium TaxID=157920 RepID=UPI002097FF0A|nr:glycoside hydrolase family 6 protein [Cellulosimicrobium cellulans]MCO7274628.1 glycoside hydrolase family 6 protein [Cellulosimicrobium cellulans]